jgi:hypothetical protein
VGSAFFSYSKILLIIGFALGIAASLAIFLSKLSPLVLRTILDADRQNQKEFDLYDRIINGADP